MAVDDRHPGDATRSPSISPPPRWNCRRRRKTRAPGGRRARRSSRRRPGPCTTRSRPSATSSSPRCCSSWPPRHAPDRPGGEADLARPGALLPGARGQGTAGRSRFTRSASMAHDCEKASGVQWSTPGDPRVTPRRRLPPQDAPGRAAAAVERAARRHEPGRPAAGAARVHARAGAGHPALPRPPGRAARRHRPGPGPAAARHRPGERPPKTRLRPLLHPLSRPVAGPASRRLHGGPHGWACPTRRCARCSPCRGRKRWKSPSRSTAGRGRSSRRDAAKPRARGRRPPHD